MSDSTDDYVSVAERIAEFSTRYPMGSLGMAEPFRIEHMPNGATFVAVTATAVRYPGDSNPGIGMAWEPVPGLTEYTRDSELQNAQTSAWGRAITAVFAADVRKGIASSDEVRNRRADQRAEGIAEAQAAPAKAGELKSQSPITTSDRRKLSALAKVLGIDEGELPSMYQAWKHNNQADMNVAGRLALTEFREWLKTEGNKRAGLSEEAAEVPA